MAIKLEYVKVANYKKQTVCKYNDGCQCEVRNCYKCGWNPVVAKMRLAKLQEKGRAEDGK